MKLVAYDRRPYTVNYFSYTLVQDPDGGTSKTYTFGQTLRVMFFVETDKVIIYTKEKLLIGGRLADFTDRAGKSMLVNANNEPYLYEIKTVEPVVNPLGFYETTRYTARRVL